MNNNAASVLSALSSNPAQPVAPPSASSLKADLKAKLVERYASLTGTARTEQIASDLSTFEAARKAAAKVGDSGLAASHALACEVLRDIDTADSGFFRKVAVAFGGASPSQISTRSLPTAGETRAQHREVVGAIRGVGDAVEAGRTETRWGLAFLGAAIGATLAAASRGADASERSAAAAERHVDHAVDAPIRNAAQARAAYNNAVAAAADAAEALGAATREHLKAERDYRANRTTLAARVLLRAEAAKEVAQEDLAAAEQELRVARDAAEKFRGV